MPHKATDKLEEITEELGLDLDVDDVEDYSLHHTEPETGDVDMATYELSIIQPYTPGQGRSENLEQNYLLNDGSQLSILIKRRPQCPSCGYTLAEEEDGKHLLETHEVCPKCMVRCNACGEIMTDEESNGHGLEDESYCDNCWQEVDQQVRHERKLDRREKDLQELKEQLDHQRQMQRIQIERQQKQRNQKLEAARLKLEMAKMVNQLKNADQIQQESRMPDHFQGVPARFKEIRESANKFQQGGNQP